MKRYGIYSRVTRDFYSSGGKVLWHTSAPELEFLFPGTPTQEIPRDWPEDHLLHISMHPELIGVLTFPLTREQFQRTH